MSSVCAAGSLGDRARCGAVEVSDRRVEDKNRHFAEYHEMYGRSVPVTKHTNHCDA